MMTFVLAFGLMVLLITGMAVGVIVSKKPIAGSCGGLNKIGLGGDCEICGGNTRKCEEEQERKSSASNSLAYDAAAARQPSSD